MKHYMSGPILGTSHPKIDVSQSPTHGVGEVERTHIQELANFSVPGTILGAESATTKMNLVLALKVLTQIATNSYK